MPMDFRQCKSTPNIPHMQVGVIDDDLRAKLGRLPWQNPPKRVLLGSNGQCACNFSYYTKKSFAVSLSRNMQNATEGFPVGCRAHEDWLEIKFLSAPTQL